MNKNARAKKPETPPSEDNLDAVILFMVAGKTDAEIRELLPDVEGHPLDRSTIEKTIEAARRKITLAADYARDEQIGIAIKRLNDLYARSFKFQDFKTSIACQKELNKLLGLYETTESESDPDERSEADEDLAKIRDHLIPLRLAPDDYPLAEHARIAAERIREADPPAEKSKKSKRKGSQS